MKTNTIDDKKILHISEEEREAGLKLIANEEMMARAVERGDLQELRKYYEAEKKYYHDVYGRISLNQCRYYFCVTAGEMARTAGRTGVDKLKSLRKLKRYLELVEGAGSKSEVGRLLWTMVTDFCLMCRVHKEEMSPSPFIYKCQEYVETHITDQISVSDLSDHLRVSTSTLNRRFRKYTDMSPARFILHCKINVAREMLKDTSLSVSEISEHLGFNDQPYFQKCFKEEVGMTPLSYRFEE